MSTALLAIDAGNTRVKWGVHEAGRWVARGMVPTGEASSQTGDDEPGTGSIDTEEARTALEGLFGAEGKVELGWVVDDEKLPKGAIRLLLNLALLAGDALVRGGRLDVGAERSGGGNQMFTELRAVRAAAEPHVTEFG